MFDVLEIFDPAHADVLRQRSAEDLHFLRHNSGRASPDIRRDARPITPVHANRAAVRLIEPQQNT